MLIKIDVNEPDKTVFSNKDWNLSLDVNQVENSGC